MQKLNSRWILAHTLTNDSAEIELKMGCSAGSLLNDFHRNQSTIVKHAYLILQYLGLRAIVNLFLAIYSV